MQGIFSKVASSLGPDSALSTKPLPSALNIEGEHGEVPPVSTSRVCTHEMLILKEEQPQLLHLECKVNGWEGVFFFFFAFYCFVFLQHSVLWQIGKKIGKFSHLFLFLLPFFHGIAVVYLPPLLLLINSLNSSPVILSYFFHLFREFKLCKY